VCDRALDCAIRTVAGAMGEGEAAANGILVNYWERSFGWLGDRGLGLLIDAWPGFRACPAKAQSVIF
jgi:hypothetical protein